LLQTQKIYIQPYQPANDELKWEEDKWSSLIAVMKLWKVEDVRIQRLSFVSRYLRMKLILSFYSSTCSPQGWIENT